MHTVAVLVGSLRRDSVTRKVTKAIEALAQAKLSFAYADLGSLPMYNEDLWETPPAGVLAMKSLIEASDAVLFVTPEYNRTIPPVVKNAIDWGSRPWGKSSWNGKPGALIGVSPGAIGGAVALSHMRSTLTALDMILMGQPEMYFTFKPDTLDESGAFADEGTRAFIYKYVTSFAAWIDRTAQPKADTQPGG